MWFLVSFKGFAMFWNQSKPPISLDGISNLYDILSLPFSRFLVSPLLFSDDSKGDYKGTSNSEVGTEGSEDEAVLGKTPALSLDSLDSLDWWDIRRKGQRAGQLKEGMKLNGRNKLSEQDELDELNGVNEIRELDE